MDLDSAHSPGSFFTALATDLKCIALSNIDYFQSGTHSHQARFHAAFSLLHEYLETGIEPAYSQLCPRVARYDFSPRVKGNGYRSLLAVVHKCCLHLLQLSRYISSVRDSILFRKKFYAKELESYVAALGQLRAVLYYALKLTHYCRDGQLFVDETQLNSDVAEQLVLEVESLSQDSFYGRCLGFQFCQSMQRPMQLLAIAMASYSEGYLEPNQMMQVATSVFNSGKYILDPELRAQQMVKVTRTADIQFCKAFWGFSESSLMHQLPSYVCPSVEVNEVITLGPDAFQLPLVSGEDTVVITPPCAHTGPGHVYTRLISAHLRDGQHSLRKSSKLKTPTSTKPKALGLIIHIHGGGFVAQSSKSHEVYLREWAVSVDVPILSVDYSLAPESPFPRALEECFYAFAWAVQNCGQLGSTGEKIVLVGDSAGGNLAISTAMRAVSFGIRAPDGILAVYPCTVVRYTPSPARLLSLMDPVLPVGLITRCLAAYAGINEQQPMASPRMDDVHSEQSLTSIQLKSYEVVDNDWIMIAQGEEEVHAVQSPDPTIDNSPINGIARTKDHQLEPPDPGGSRDHQQKSSDIIEKMEHSDTPDSEHEIFFRLECDGSVALPPGVEGHVARVTTPAAGQELSRYEENANVNQSEISGNSGLEMPLKPKLARLGMLQERARLMVEGAQSMFSKVSSYMPATRDMSTQNVISSLSSLLPVSSATIGPTADTAASQQPADTASKQSADAAISQQPTETASSQQPAVVSNTETWPEPADEALREGVSALGKHLVDTDVCLAHSPDDTVTSTGCPSPHSAALSHVTISRARSDASDGQSLLENRCAVDRLDPQEVPTGLANDTEFLSPLNEISQDSDVAMVTSSSFHTTSSSQVFDTAYSSPLSPSLPGSTSLDNCESISPSSESSSNPGHHPVTTAASVCDPGPRSPSDWTVVDGDHQVGPHEAPHLAESSPHAQKADSVTKIHPGATREMSSNACGDKSRDVHQPAADDCVLALHGAGLDTCSDSHGNPHVYGTCEDSDSSSPKLGIEDSNCLSGTTNEGSSHLSLKYAGIEEDKDCHRHGLEMLSPEIDMATFCVDDLISGPVSPRILPTLPEEKKQLLEDALETCDVPPELIIEAELFDQVHLVYAAVCPCCHPAASHSVGHGSQSQHMEHDGSDVQLEEGDGSHKISAGHGLSDGHDSCIDCCPPDHGQHSSSQTDSETQHIHKSHSDTCASSTTDTEMWHIHKANSDTETQHIHKAHSDTCAPSPTRGQNSYDCQVKIASATSSILEPDVQGLKGRQSKPAKPTSLELKKKVRPFPGGRALSLRSPCKSIDRLPSVSSQAPTSVSSQVPTSVSSQAPTSARQTLDSARKVCGSSLPSSPSVSRSHAFLRHGSLPSLFSPSTGNSHAKKASSSTSCHHDSKTGSISPADCVKQDFVRHSPLHRLRKAAVVNNPYMSPLLAPDELLRDLPLVSIVACHLDPLLDDSVMFARRLRDLQVPVSLHLVDDLPHGFLNFALLSAEAKQAADLCARKLSEMLQCSHV
ncbi:hypothetical protein BsWGS_17065 [Bradybaena similaris]